MESAYVEVTKATKVLKNSFGFVYGIYAMSFYSNLFSARYFTKDFVNTCT